MAQMGRPGLSSQQKHELWARWKAGRSLSDIGRSLGRHEREEIYRGLVAGLSLRKIAAQLGERHRRLAERLDAIRVAGSIGRPMLMSVLGDRLVAPNRVGWLSIDPCRWWWRRN